MTPGTESARRLAATQGDGDPHLWRWPAAGWGCTLGDTAVAPSAAQAWETLTGRPARRHRALHLTRRGGVWGCRCDIGGGVVVRVLGADPCAAIRSCRAIGRAG